MIPASRVVPKAFSFHSVEKHYATNYFDKAFKAGTITQRDIALMREFVVEKQSCNNITLGRANKIIYTLIGWRNLLGPFKSNTFADIFAAKTELETSKNRFGNSYKQKITMLRSDPIEELPLAAGLFTNPDGCSVCDKLREGSDKPPCLRHREGFNYQGIIPLFPTLFLHPDIPLFPLTIIERK